MDFWAHMPDLSSGLTPAHRYKIVAANENCGDAVTLNNSTTFITTAGTGGNGWQGRDRTKGCL